MKECPNCKCVLESDIRYCKCGYDIEVDRLDYHRVPINEFKKIIKNKIKLISNINRSILKKIKSLSPLIFYTVLVNAIFSILGAYLSLYILIGYYGFMFDKPTVISKGIASLVVIIFLAIIITSNYSIIKKALGKRVYYVLTGLVTFILGFILAFHVIYT